MPCDSPAAATHQALVDKLYRACARVQSWNAVWRPAEPVIAPRAQQPWETCLMLVMACLTRGDPWASAASPLRQADPASMSIAPDVVRCAPPRARQSWMAA